MEGPAGSGIEDVSFGSVDPFLEAIKKQLADPDLAGNPLLGSYRKLVERYETMRRTLVRTVRITDQYQQRLRTLNRELDLAMRTDYLTGLLNRRAFYDRLKAELSRSRRHARPLCILMADVDHFKGVNDRYGHDVGDAVLKETAQAFCLCLRDEDLKVRWGGEEFLALLLETDARGAVAAAEKLRNYLAAREIAIGQSCIRVTISVGVAQKGQGGAEEAIKEADKALYEAKQSGRNRVVLAQDGCTQNGSKRSEG